MVKRLIEEHQCELADICKHFAGSDEPHSKALLGQIGLRVDGDMLEFRINRKYAALNMRELTNSSGPIVRTTVRAWMAAANEQPSQPNAGLSGAGRE